MDFQAEVGTWLAAHLPARMPVGGRFGLANAPLPVSIQLETGHGLDDIRLEQDDTTRYIADYRSTLEDNARRAALVQILRLFADVGWREALKLLYPDLLR